MSSKKEFEALNKKSAELTGDEIDMKRAELLRGAPTGKWLQS